MTPVYVFAAVLLVPLIGQVIHTRGGRRDALLAAIALLGSVGLWLIGLAPLPEQMTTAVWQYSLPWFAFGCASMTAIRAFPRIDRSTVTGLVRRMAEYAARLDQPTTER